MWGEPVCDFQLFFIDSRDTNILRWRASNRPFQLFFIDSHVPAGAESLCSKIVFQLFFIDSQLVAGERRAPEETVVFQLFFIDSVLLEVDENENYASLSTLFYRF